MASNGHDHDAGPMRRRGLLRCSVRVAVASAGLFLVSAPEARAQAAGGRMALVVGNGAYAHTAALANPVNDADDVGAALEGLGFSVRIRKNLDRAALYDEVAAFGRRSAASEISVLFYAGHGIEVNGTSYLVPVDARLATDTDTHQAMPLDDVQARIGGAGLRLVILDACRDNPLATRMRLSDPTRSFSRGGLGALRSEQLGGTLVWYAASAGETVPDGGVGARNSPFTRALLTHLADPVEVGTMFVRVTNTVYRATGGRQEPTAYGSRRSEYYLSRSDPSPPSPGDEDLWWQSALKVDTVEGYLEYERRYPAGRYVVLSRALVAALRSDPPDPVPTYAAGDVFRDCAACPEMVVIPAGTFMMGSPASEAGRYDDEGPRHQVTLGSFALGRYEVTRAEYAAFVSATGHDVSGGCHVLDYNADDRLYEWPHDENASWRSPGFSQGGDHPVVCVNWRDAQAFVDWLSRETGERYRLPSESEWEYAARAGTSTRRWWGDEAGAQQCEYANGGDATYEQEVLRRFVDADWGVAECTDGSARTAPVGSFSPNDFGLHDVLGNVWEWVEDCWHNDYSGAPSDGTAWERGGNCGRRVLRGSSWLGYSRTLRSAARYRYATGARLGGAGFRVSRTLD